MQKTAETHRLSVTVPATLDEDLTKAAEANYSSKAAEIRRALAAWVSSSRDEQKVVAS